MSRRKNLKHAREVRASQISDLRRLKNGHMTLTDVLRNPQTFFLESCSIYNVLRHAPHLGEKGARKVCVQARVFPLDKLGDLTVQERDKILSCLPPRAR